jgi:hypothetical protein
MIIVFDSFEWIAEVCSETDIGVRQNMITVSPIYGLQLFDVIDEPLFFLSVIKYGIRYSRWGRH